jgi:hypothetical protein
MELKGKWWFPTKEKMVYYGSFKYDQTNEIYLEILDDPNTNLKYDIDIILGILENGQRITLFKCSLIKHYQLLSHFPISLFKAKFAFLGVHYNSDKDIKFPSVIIKYNNINSFISQYSLIYDPSFNGEINHNQSREITIPKYCKIIIYPQSKKLFNSDLLFEIQSFRDKSFDDYIELKSILHDFLNFVISDEVFVDAIYVADENSQIDSNLQILYKSTRPSFPEKSKKMFKPQVKTILFHYQDISLQFEEIIRKWFELSEQYNHPYDLYFGVIYNIDQYDVYRFLMLTTAAEVYHKLLTGNNNTIFKDRIKNLYETYSNIVKIFLKTKNIDKAVEVIEGSRHYYTHYDPKRIANTVKDNDLFWITKDLQFVLQLCFLTQLGFDNNRLEKLFYMDKI